MDKYTQDEVENWQKFFNAILVIEIFNGLVIVKADGTYSFTPMVPKHPKRKKWYRKHVIDTGVPGGRMLLKLDSTYEYIAWEPKVIDGVLIETPNDELLYYAGKMKREKPNNIDK